VPSHRHSQNRNKIWSHAKISIRQRPIVSIEILVTLEQVCRYVCTDPAKLFFGGKTPCNKSADLHPST
jgi:hypothetical protein